MTKRRHRPGRPAEGTTHSPLPNSSSDRGVLVTEYEERLSIHSGPLPPPETLVQYNQAYPGCAEDIVRMAVSQAEHRQQLERRVVDAQIAAERRGQISSVAVGVACEPVATNWPCSALARGRGLLLRSDDHLHFEHPSTGSKILAGPTR
jgi:hypothetical protein